MVAQSTSQCVLSEAENKTESRLRETAVEERDRAEEETSTNARRLAKGNGGSQRDGSGTLLKTPAQPHPI